MNFLSIILLLIVALCLCLAAVAIVRRRKRPGRCAGCSFSGCCDRKCE